MAENHRMQEKMNQESGKAICFTAPQRIEGVEVAAPAVLGDDEAWVRTHRMGVCGTDISGYLGKMPFFSYPRIPGHELGLEVVAVGKNVTHLRVGDRCSLEPYINDPLSATSLRGHSNCCPGVQVMGVHCDGGLRTSPWAVPARKLHVGNALNYEQLALVETLAIGLHAVQRGNPQPGETVLVIGAGPIGLACLEFLKLRDLQVVVMDRVAARLDFCRDKLGLAESILSQGDAAADEAALASLTNGKMADVIIDATGSVHSMSHCFHYAAFTGRVVYVGITTEELRFPHAPVFHRRELTLLASRNALPADFPAIIELIEQGQISTDHWITHRMAFADVRDQFVNLTQPSAGTIKAIIEVQD